MKETMLMSIVQGTLIMFIYIYSTAQEVNFCIEGTLDLKKAKGAILVCHRWGSPAFDKCTQVTSVGAVGIVILNSAFFGNEIYVEPYLCPATHISYSNELQVSYYVNSTSKNARQHD